MGVRGFDLLGMAVKRNFKVVVLTAHALIPEALRQCFERKARAYLPKEKFGEIVPFLEDVFQYGYRAGWRRLLEGLRDSFEARFTSGVGREDRLELAGGEIRGRQSLGKRKNRAFTLRYFNIDSIPVFLARQTLS